LNKSLRRITLIASLILVATAQPTYALFGSECRNAKKSHSDYLSKAKVLMAQEDKDAVIRWRESNQALKKCESNPKKYGDKRFGKFPCLAYELAAPKKPVPVYSKANTEIKNANQVILNNQKCFKPEQVIEAQRILGVIK